MIINPMIEMVVPTMEITVNAVFEGAFPSVRDLISYN